MGTPNQDVNPNTVVGRQIAASPEKLVSVKLNWRYGNVNAGEIAGYPPEEAQRLCETRVPGTNLFAAELNKRAAKD